MADIEMHDYEAVTDRDTDPHTYMRVGSAVPKTSPAASPAISCRTVCLLLIVGIALCAVTSTITVAVYHVVIGAKPATTPDHATTSSAIMSEDMGELKSLVQEIKETLNTTAQAQYDTLTKRIDSMNISHTRVVDGLTTTTRTCEAIEEKLVSSEQQVAFSVHYPRSTLTSDRTPTFTRTILNVGGGYNATTGKFTCPTSGIYSFSVTIRHDSTDTGNPGCNYRVNGVHQTYVQAYKDAYDQASGTMVVKLVVGDVVDLQCYSWKHALHYTTGTTFSGVLITPVILN